jgi:hypothetical protein
MLAWIKEFRDNWTGRPWAAFVAIVIGAICGFGVATFWWSGTVSTLRERVAFLQETKSPSQLRIVEVTKGPSYRVQAGDDVIHVNNSEDAPITIFLPSGFVRGKVVTIKDKRGNAFSVHINIVSDAGTIDGISTLVIGTNKGYFSLIWDGVDWSMN